MVVGVYEATPLLYIVFIRVVRAGVRVERFLIIVLVSIVVLVVCHTISHWCPQEHAKHPTTRNAINTTRKGPTTEYGVFGGTGQV